MTRFSRILAAACLMASVPLHAADSTYRLNIEPQPLATALQQFARQSGLQIVYYGKIAEGYRAREVVGNLTAAEALKQLLDGTDLKFEALDRNTVAISPVREGVIASKKVSSLTGEQTGAASLRLAQAQTETATAQKAPDTEEQNQKGIPEILVKGHRSSNTDIERTADDVQPYVVFDSTTIERSMASNLEQFLKTRLPMNTRAASSSQVSGASFGNQSEIDLRGLGSNQTLILLNGRRMPAISNATLGGTFAQPDINGIPLSTIERIEVLPSTASGIYGGGATGGVINIVLKRNQRGFDVRAGYDNTFESDVSQRSLQTSAGFDFQDGKTSVLLSASYSDANELKVGERDLVQRSRALMAKNNYDSFLFDYPPPAGATPNITSYSGFDLVFDDGTPLGSWATYVPAGYAGISTDGGAALLRNAGQYNLELPNDLNGLQSSLLSNPKIESYSANVRHEFGSRVEAFLDFNRYENTGRTVYGDPPLETLVSADAPNNPFDEDIVVSFPTPGLSAIATNLSRTTQAAGGIVVRLARDWSLQGDYSWSESRNASRTASPLVSQEGEAAIYDGTLDVVRDVNLAPIDFTPYRLQNPNQISGPADTLLESATLRLAGPLFKLPGGPMTLSALLERQGQKAKAAYLTSPDFSVYSTLRTVYYPMRRQDVQSAYVETFAPLVSTANARPFMRTFELQASARRDHYRTDTVPSGAISVGGVGDIPDLSTVVRTVATAASTDYTFGLRYAPADALTLRLSYGTGFLPASINQLVSSRSNASRVSVLDPKRGGLRYTAFIPVLRGGNPDLDPEQSRSWSAGMILKPQWLSGLRLSVDYTRIDKTDEIRSLGDQLTVDNEDLLPGRIQRAALSQMDRDRGYTGGLITFADFTLLNVATTSIDSYDVQATYDWENAAGRFSAYVLGTWQPHFKRQVIETAPVVDISGFNGSSALEWRGNGGLTWERNAWTLAWNAQYYDSYRVYGAESPLSLQTSIAANQGSDTVPRRLYHDLQFEYRFAGHKWLGGMLDRTEFTAGIQNVFNTSPPILAASGLFGNYSFYGDPRLRRYSLSLRKSF